MGNLGWALLRKKANMSEGKIDETETDILVKRAYDTILGHSENAVTIFVHLHSNPESTMRRRESDHSAKTRLPMANEESECSELHELLDDGIGEHLVAFEKMGIPTLVVDNSKDGDGCIHETTEKIVKFILSNIWRCAVHC